MSCVFLAVPPFPTLSRLRRDAKRIAEDGNTSYQPAFAQILDRQVKGLSPEDLNEDYVAHLRDNGWLTVLFLGFALSVVTGRSGGVVANLGEAPVGFSISIDADGFDGDPYVGDFSPCLTVRVTHCQEEQGNADLVNFPMVWSAAEREIMADTDRPIRERLGTLLYGLRNALEALMFQSPEKVKFEVCGQDESARRAHREAAHVVRDILLSRLIRYKPHHLIVLDFLFRAAAPASAAVWKRAITTAETLEERIDIRRRAAEIGQEVFGDLPIEEYISEDGLDDWENVLDHLELREALVSELTAAGKTSEAMGWRNGLHAEVRRVRELIEDQRRAS